jgi:hypothetical protein
MKRAPSPRQQIKFPTDAQLRKSCPAIWMWYDDFFPDRQHPIRSRLVLALVRRECYLQAPAGYRNGAFPPGPTTLPKLLEAASSRMIPYWQQEQHQAEFLRVYNEARDIMTWLHPHPTEPAWKTFLLHTTQAMLQQGVSLEEILKTLPKLTDNPRGAKAKANMRIAAVKALELKMKGSENSWARVTRKVCPCGKGSHDNACVQRIRQTVIRLKKLLAFYGV